VLSLDAPLVVIAWQWLIARTLDLPLTTAAVLVLAASTWLAYAADRWIEGWRLAPQQVQTHRHGFYQRHRRGIAAIWLAMLYTDLQTAWRGLSARELLAGALLLAAVLVYLLSHQFLHRHRRWRLPKELCVALLLTGGVAVFLVGSPAGAPRAIGTLLTAFGALCLANCALISLWERDVDTAHGQTSLALQLQRGRFLIRALPWALGLIALGFTTHVSPAERPFWWCAAASGLFLGLVDLAHAKRLFGRQPARVLADLAMLTPLLAWIPGLRP